MLSHPLQPNATSGNSVPLGAGPASASASASALPGKEETNVVEVLPRAPRVWNSTLPSKRLKPRRTSKASGPGLGASTLHPGPWRSEVIKDLAAEAPCCMNCGDTKAALDGKVVGCHSNSLQDGKGKGQKAHDLVAYLCPDCHDLIDGRAGQLTREEKQAMFYRAVYKTVLWLLQSGRLQVAA